MVNSKGFRSDLRYQVGGGFMSEHPEGTAHVVCMNVCVFPVNLKLD